MSAKDLEDRTRGLYGSYGKVILDPVLSIHSFIIFQSNILYDGGIQEISRQ